MGIIVRNRESSHCDATTTPPPPLRCLLYQAMCITHPVHQSISSSVHLSGSPISPSVRQSNQSVHLSIGASIGHIPLYSIQSHSGHLLSLVSCLSSLVSCLSAIFSLLSSHLFFCYLVSYHALSFPTSRPFGSTRLTTSEDPV